MRYHLAPKHIHVAIIILTLALLIGCQVGGPSSSSFTVTLSTPRSVRDILPNGTNTTVVRYNLYFDGPGDDDFEVLDYSGTEYTKEDASPGEWLLGVFGENSAGTVVSSSTTITFTLDEGESESVTAECSTYPVRGVYTLAGSGAAGSGNGTGTGASFNAPKGLVVDSSGIIYVADTGNNQIRKVTTLGVVTTLAGSGSAGSTDGAGAAASFDHPVGIAVDSSGNLYVSEWGNDAIRKISPAGVVTTLVAGGANSDLDNPSGLALDSSGNLFVADTGSSTIKKVTSSGTVLAFAGITDSPGWFDSSDPTQARFDSPQGLSIDASTGTLYVADTGNHRLRKVTSSGVVTTLIGDYAGYEPGFAEGNSTSGKMNGPKGISYFGNVYIGDTGNHATRVYLAYNSNLNTQAGKDPEIAPLNQAASGLIDGNYPDARFNSPEGLCTYNDFTYVADTGNNVIRKIVN